MTNPSSAKARTHPGLGCFLYGLIALFGAAAGYRANDYSEEAILLGAIGLVGIMIVASIFWDMVSLGDSGNSSKRGCATFSPTVLLGSVFWAFGLALLASRPFWVVFWESLAAGLISAVVFFGLTIFFKLHKIDRTKPTASYPWEVHNPGCLDNAVLFFLLLCKTVFDLIFGRRKD